LNFGEIGRPVRRGRMARFDEFGGSQFVFEQTLQVQRKRDALRRTSLQHVRQNQEND